VSLERFVWTAHAEMRLRQRRLLRDEIERAIRDGHDRREVNDGRAQWLVRGMTSDGEFFEAIYDHPHGLDGGAARIVSVWRPL
jgi:hypothetical protein